MCKSRAAGIICGVIVNLALFCSAAAAPVDQNSFAAAQADYNAGRYAAARDAFARFAQAYPSNSLSHYYLALCQQQTGNVASAKREYQTVIALGDPRLKIQAEAALAALSGGARARSGQSPTEVVSPIFSTEVKQIDYGARGNIDRVLEFYADWCGPCKKFAPIYDKVSRKFSRINFSHHNVDAPGVAPLKAQYEILSIPTMVFLDKNGKVLFKGNCPASEQILTNLIAQYNR
jgi:thioredoxin 1